MNLPIEDNSTAGTSAPTHAMVLVFSHPHALFAGED